MHILSLVGALLLADFAFCRPVQAQLRDVEYTEPRRLPSWYLSQLSAPARAEAERLAVARALQAELHLNEHGVIRALKYLRQGYPVSEVRNLFAPVIRKS